MHLSEIGLGFLFLGHAKFFPVFGSLRLPTFSLERSAPVALLIIRVAVWMSEAFPDHHLPEKVLACRPAHALFRIHLLFSTPVVAYDLHSPPAQQNVNSIKIGHLVRLVYGSNPDAQMSD